MSKEQRTPNRYEVRVFKSQVRTVSAEEGIIEAIVSAFGVEEESYGTRMRVGCWGKGLQERTPKGVWMHRSDQTVARTLEARELMPNDPLLPEAIRLVGGLYIKGQFNLDTQRGREAFSDVKFGIVDEFSVGFWIVRSEYDWDADIEEFIECVCYEWSPVLVGGNPGTSVLSVRDEPRDGQRWADQANAFRDSAAAFLDRISRIETVRGKLSDQNRQLLVDAVAETRKVADAMEALASRAESEPAPDAGELLRNVEALRIRELELRTRSHTVTA